MNSPDTNNLWQHWTLQQRDGVAHLIFDQQNSKVNTLSETVLAELKIIIDVLQQQRPEGYH